MLLLVVEIAKEFQDANPKSECSLWDWNGANAKRQFSHVIAHRQLLTGSSPLPNPVLSILIDSEGLGRYPKEEPLPQLGLACLDGPLRLELWSLLISLSGVSFRPHLRTRLPRILALTSTVEQKESKRMRGCDSFRSPSFLGLECRESSECSKSSDELSS